MQIGRHDFTTLADGTKTASSNERYFGLVQAVQLVDGDLADGVDISVYNSTLDGDFLILTKADFNSDSMYYPRVLEHLNTDGTALSTHTLPVISGQIKVVITQGGNVKSGAVVLHII